MYKFIKDGTDQGAQLISFPEENGTLILGMLPLVETILARFTESGKPNKGQSQKEDDPPIDISGILSILSPFMRKVFESTFSELSKAFGVYIMAGSIMLEDQGKAFNRAYLFGPDGNIIGTQDKVHLVVLEGDMGLEMGSKLDIFHTELGRIAFPVCMDATYFETFKILKDRGAEIIIIPIADMEEYNHYFALRGIWPRVQESGVYGIKSALVGDLFGIKFTGKAGVYAPMNITPKMDGIIKEASTFNRDELVISDIDIDSINDYHDEYLSDENPEFFSKYFPKVYENMD